MSFATFMSTQLGRVLRGVLGIALFSLGYVLLVTRGSLLGAILLLGLIPFVASICDFSLISWMMGAPLWGRGKTEFRERDGTIETTRQPSDVDAPQGGQSGFRDRNQEEADSRRP